MAAANLTAARLRELLLYDPTTGIFHWRVSRKGTRRDGLAGGVSAHGYVKIGVDRTGQQYAHRLAWLYMVGEWPTGEIDHINGDRADNRWANLREVTPRENKQNKRKPQRNNKSGFLGVSISSNCPSRWIAQIKLPNGKNKSIGMFKTPEEAHEAYLRVKRAIHKGCTI
jgi:hypothetical protein